MILTQTQAEEVWTYLVENCGAGEGDRDMFVHHAQDASSGIPGWRLEYRFIGSLGFGGKIYLEEPPRISCSQEDETPERKKTIEHANKYLAGLFGIWKSSAMARVLPI